MYALRHTKVIHERKEVERIPKRDDPLEDPTNVDGFEKGGGEGDGENDENARDGSFPDVGDTEVTDVYEIFAYPAILVRFFFFLVLVRFIQISFIGRKKDSGFTSITVKMALRPTPTMNTRRSASCADGNCLVSNMESKMRPSPPMKEPKIASPENTRSRLLISGTSLPSHRAHQYQVLA